MLKAALRCIRLRIRPLLLAACALAVGAASAQQYPSKPVRIMVGYSPGGGVDTTARIVAAALAGKDQKPEDDAAFGLLAADLKVLALTPPQAPQPAGFA